MRSRKIILGILSVVLLVVTAIVLVKGFTEEDSEEEVAQEQESLPAEDSQGEDEHIQEDEEESTEDEATSSEDLDPIWYEESVFELPINGAGGYTSVETILYETATVDANEIEVLPIGTPFIVIEEQGNWWKIQTKEQEGWIENTLAMINLPDVMPSIIYDNPNNYSSEFRSSFTDIPGITGETLYEGYAYNERLDKDEFIMPIIYSTAEKIAQAQQTALENEETLVVMETFRPRSVQILVNERLSALAEENEEVRRGITEEPWQMSWFISSGVSNHQRGLAVDLTLAQINERGERTVGDFIVPEVLDYSVYEMYTPIFELSTASAMLMRPISARDRTGWQEIPYQEYVNEEAIRLEEYMFEADMIPIPSEWWHFNDIDILEEYEEELGNGDFYLDSFFNQKPIRTQ